MQGSMFHSEYSRFSDKLWSWKSSDEFVKESLLRDGIHQIALSDGRYFDLLLRGVRGKYKDLPVFFNGAVVRENTKPPYFSGSNVAVAASVPVIAVADPTLNLSSELGIGWYTGGIGSEFDSALVNVLSFLRNETTARLVMVGGSAGGYAALRFGTLLNESALVWNPQIDFLKYNPDHVGRFLATRFNEPSWSNKSSKVRDENGNILLEEAHLELQRTGISHEIESLDNLDRLVYLQNKSDNHEKVHAKPIRERSELSAISRGIYNYEDRTMLVADFNVGHRAPSRELITYALKKMLLGESPTSVIAQNILTEFEIQT